MTKIEIVAIATIMAAFLTGCAHGSGGGYGPAYYGTYYDGYYGPFDGGYWGPDNSFYYYDGDGYHRDSGDHFRHHAHRGFHHLHWRGSAYRDAQFGHDSFESDASPMEHFGRGDDHDAPDLGSDRH